MPDKDIQQLKKNLSKIISERVVEIFNNMFNVEVKITEEDLVSFNDDDLVSRVKLYSDDLDIILRFAFPRPMLVPLLQQIYDPIIANHETTIQDATCEIANIVCGGLKKNLSDIGYSFDMELPVVDYNLSRSSNENFLEINFMLQKLKFLVDCQVEKNNET